VQARHRSRQTRLVGAEVEGVSEVEVSVAAGVTLIAGGSVFSGFSRSCDAPSVLWRSFYCWWCRRRFDQEVLWVALANNGKSIK
jgi:hypothetical protein